MEQRVKRETVGRMNRYQLAHHRVAGLYSRVARITVCSVLFFVLTGTFSLPAMAEIYKQINFEWEYDTSLPELAGYILYQDGRHLQTIYGPGVQSVDLSVGLTPGRTAVFTMKAFDEDGNESAMSAPYRLEVPEEVEGNNFLPIPRLLTRTGGVPLEIAFSAKGSTDFDGAITSYHWEFGDGTQATGALVVHRYEQADTFLAKLTVTDDHGGQSISEQMVTVLPGSQPVSNPVAGFNAYPQDPVVLQAVWFSGLPSSVSNGNINRYLWDFGDGTSATGAITFHRYWQPGTYMVTLTVWDEQGGSDEKSVALTVSPFSS